MIQDSGQRPNEDDGDVLDISQAASRLGISADAVRKRIRRKRLRAYKVDGEWRVVLPLVSSVPLETPDDPSRTEARTDLDIARDAGFLRVMRENERLLTLTEDQAAAIREQAQTIEAQRRTIAELTERLLSPSQRPPEPPAELPHSAPETAATPPARRSWWRRWFGG